LEATSTASTFRALRHRNFRLFWFGQMISLAGTWMQMTAQSWLVLTLTESPLKLGLVNSLQFAPMLVFTLYAGVLADRLPKRRIVMTTQAAMALCALVLAGLTLGGWVRYWHILVLAALVGTARAFDTPARQAFFVEMVGREDLMNAIALNSSVFNLARVVGPALAGLVIKLIGTGWAFLANGLSYFAVIYALAMMDIPDRVRPARTGAIRDIAAGVAYVRGTPSVFGIIALLGVVGTLALNLNVLVPLLARGVLGLDSSGYGFLMAAMGTGAFTGALALATFAGRGPQVRLLIGAAALLGVGEVVLGSAGGFGPAGVILFACGLALVTYLASSNTTVQAIVPDELRGRVMSLYFLVLGGTAPLGAFIAGAMAEHLGTQATLWSLGGLTAAATAAMGLAGALPAPPSTAGGRTAPGQGA